MNYLALYRKYRPKELDEVVGQSEIKKILASSVNNGTITHAYLFSGPRGTGKTTMAKILAKMVNCLNPVDGNACNKCENCLNILNSNDVIEIDAASNNGVDEIRELREKANLVPNFAKYKIYIIDEVHMLTTQAFNALLKTLEEPPKHVIFILATTEYYKIPLTITSRCQKFQFNKICNEDIVKQLKKIANLENILIEDDALEEIAKISDGGMRDSINFLDQLRSFTNEKITVDNVYDVCGYVTNSEFIKLFTAIRNNDDEVMTEFFEMMDESGKNYSKFLEGILSVIKDVVLFNKNVNNKYIKNDLNFIKNINDLFSYSELLLIIEYVNNLIDKLKYSSRQSIIVITNFLLLMYNLNKKTEISDVNIKIDKSDVSDTDKYDTAFQFTSTEDNIDSDFTDNSNNSENNISVEDNNNGLEDAINFKEIIINNAFAVANKEVKNNLQQLASKFNEYLTDKKYKVAASTLIDTQIEVAGNGYIIFSAKSEAIVDKVHDKYKNCQEFINFVFGDEYKFVVLTYDEWCSLRDVYVKDFKNGKKYVLKPLDDIKEDESTSLKKESVVDKLFDLVGEENIEFK
jgi:DNA polymerase-3 subunit gamma/tau